jgi:molecular chaperone DnaK (HSP70)
MKPSKQPSGGENQEEFEKELEDVERSLILLKERYTQVQADQSLQVQLQEQLQEISQKRSSTQMKAELRQIKQQLEMLEINLESRLFSWVSFREPFWQVVRFGGMGVIIGWLLKSWVG